MTVDTLSLAKELRAAELPPMQAEANAAAIGRAVLEGAATKADLAQLEARIDAKIERLRATLIMWFVGTNLTLAAVLIAAVKL